MGKVAYKSTRKGEIQYRNRLNIKHKVYHTSLLFDWQVIYSSFIIQTITYVINYAFLYYMYM